MLTHMSDCTSVIASVDINDVGSSYEIPQRILLNTNNKENNKQNEINQKNIEYTKHNHQPQPVSQDITPTEVITPRSKIRNQSFEITETMVENHNLKHSNSYSRDKLQNTDMENNENSEKIENKQYHRHIDRQSRDSKDGRNDDNCDNNEINKKKNKNKNKNNNKTEEIPLALQRIMNLQAQLTGGLDCQNNKQFNDNDSNDSSDHSHRQNIENQQKNDDCNNNKNNNNIQNIIPPAITHARIHTQITNSHSHGYNNNNSHNHNNSHGHSQSQSEHNMQHIQQIQHIDNDSHFNDNLDIQSQTDTTVTTSGFDDNNRVIEDEVGGLQLDSSDSNRTHQLVIKKNNNQNEKQIPKEKEKQNADGKQQQQHQSENGKDTDNQSTKQKVMLESTAIRSPGPPPPQPPPPIPASLQQPQTPPPTQQQQLQSLKTNAKPIHHIHKPNVSLKQLENIQSVINDTNAINIKDKKNKKTVWKKCFFFCEIKQLCV